MVAETEILGFGSVRRQQIGSAQTRQNQRAAGEKLADTGLWTEAVPDELVSAGTPPVRKLVLEFEHLLWKLGSPAGLGQSAAVAVAVVAGVLEGC